MTKTGTCKWLSFVVAIGKPYRVLCINVGKLCKNRGVVKVIGSIHQGNDSVWRNLVVLEKMDQALQKTAMSVDALNFAFVGKMVFEHIIFDQVVGVIS